ncbi:hypothetical protein KFL_000060300 [Klebsormidium nitens]|uniref:WWE domain-containing protein n=1 Tax=Klebsormidium nitens TaxID=105231 RepID=A0A0U9HR86_KLENI|nr:hypothetical protein KFL_000060300 [Klebsormidium nitens]|eukprot:GAQ77965.1 hypothetical protein KFL_000060300 [Klebsormidium nitens]
MCITGQIDDPATPGVWWREDDEWRRYGSTHADVIKEGVRNGLTWVTLEGLSDVDGEELGETYTVDLRIMQQKSPRGFMRPVLVVDGAGATGWPRGGQALSANVLSPLLRIWQRGSSSDKWTRVSDLVARFLLRAAKTGAPTCLLDEGDGSFAMVDFQSMTKTDTVTGRTAELRVACPLDGDGIAAAIAAADHAQKKLVLHELVKSLREPDKVEGFVNEIGGDSEWKLVAQRPNPYLSYESRLYQRFLDSLAHHMHDLTGLILGKSTSTGKRKRLKESPIEYVFHGTCNKNLESILKEGMDPKKRIYGYDFFAYDAELSLGYTDEDEVLDGMDVEGNLLVFLVLTLPPGFSERTLRKNGTMVLMEKVEYELPIAVATVRKPSAGERDEN